MMKDRLLLLGCGILKKEVQLLAKKNAWDLDTHFLDSSLHCDFGALERSLRGALDRSADRRVIVFYGTCHPLLDEFLADAGTFRTPGQNCVEMLLGRELFSSELEKGAYFLLEDWARRWQWIVKKSLGTSDPKIVRAIFQSDRKYLLGVRTPCSEDFRVEAEQASELAQLPLRWIDVTLDHLEEALDSTIARKREQLK